MKAVFICCLPSASDLDMCGLHGQQKGGEVCNLRAGRPHGSFLLRHGRSEEAHGFLSQVKMLL